jgi:hypothetical protein
MQYKRLRTVIDSLNHPRERLFWQVVDIYLNRIALVPSVHNSGASKVRNFFFLSIASPFDVILLIMNSC